MATISKVDRARVIMDLVKDGEVASLADYANVEKVSGPIALARAQDFWDAPGFIHPTLVDGNGDPRDPTNEELAINYINRLRVYHNDVRAAVRVSAAKKTAGQAEAVTVAAEGVTELGSIE